MFLNTLKLIRLLILKSVFLNQVIVMRVSHRSLMTLESD